MPLVPIVILGAGYTGRSIYARAKERELPVFATSRSPAAHLSDVSPQQRIEFDLHRPETWDNIPQGSHVIWCFPAVPEEAVRAFAGRVLPQAGRVVVLGSTSAYEVGPGQSPAASVIDESAPIDHGRPRVRGEEYLRLHHHAVVLRVAGIYGPGRNVLDWIRRGKVGISC